MIAHAKGGKATLKNSKCLCYRCNKLQGTDSWATFLKKQDVEDPEQKRKESIKQALEGLTVKQLKSLADKKAVRVLGMVEEGFFESRRLAPTKSQYVKKLSGVVTEEEVHLPTEGNRGQGKPKGKRRTA